MAANLDDPFSAMSASRPTNVPAAIPIRSGPVQTRPDPRQRPHIMRPHKTSSDVKYLLASALVSLRFIMADFQPILAFNGRFDFTVAYTWEKPAIHEFLDNVAEDPVAYGAPEDRQAEIQLLRTYIKALDFPNGEIYRQDEPYQQILRKLNEFALDPTDPIPWLRHQEPFFIIFDLLGVFLSLMGPAPTTGTAPTPKNYFLPLLVVYAKWCTKLAPETNQCPTVVQVTWSTDNDTLYPFLGASARGYAHGTEGPPQQWTSLVQETRHGHLNGILQAPYTNFGTSPGIAEDAENGTNFGNCAETYPFLYVLGDNALLANSYGIAYKPSKTTRPVYEGARFWHRTRGGMLPPCINCQRLITWYGAAEERFDLNRPAV
ncbi:hypothetical protein BS17DRAFT_131870 [Gyrodon lividus]|nr:hypothetical protein BS17DRAFT_131870 [Gyrodon lividus]